MKKHLTRLAARFPYRPNLRVRQGNLACAHDFREIAGSMDSVVCLNVIEHVEDDATALRNIFNCLRPQGRAIVLVPEGPSIYGTLDRVLGHYRRYTEEELKGKMEEAGFHVERILQFNRITRPGWYWNGRILRSRRFSRLQFGFSTDSYGFGSGSTKNSRGHPYPSLRSVYAHNAAGYAHPDRRSGDGINSATE